MSNDNKKAALITLFLISFTFFWTILPWKIGQYFCSCHGEIDEWKFGYSVITKVFLIGGILIYAFKNWK